MSNAQKLLDRETNRIIADVKNEVSGFYKHASLDLDAICDAYNIRLLEGAFEDENVSGTLVKADDGWSIIVNEAHSRNRKRFTIAHELGHFFAVEYNSIQAETYLEEQGNIIRDYALMKRTEDVEDGKYQVERQANMIAAEILMPDHLVQKLYDQKMNVQEMAEQFGVSEIAMSYKLTRMGYDTLEGASDN